MLFGQPVPVLTHPERFDIELATKVYCHVTTHPEKHDQSVVMNDCGTVGCIAGWVGVFSNHHAHYRGMGFAQELLGLTGYEANYLFDGGIAECEAVARFRSMITYAVSCRIQLAQEQARIAREAERVAERAEEKRQKAHDKALRQQLRSMPPMLPPASSRPRAKLSRRVLTQLLGATEKVQ